MLFNYNDFLNELRSNPEKKNIVEKYSEFFPELIDKPIEIQPWFKNYCTLFLIKRPDDLLLPNEIKRDFDWELFQKILAGSFSSEVKYILLPNGKYEIEIMVQTNDQIVIKKLSELWGFQVLRLYEIYVEEQLNLQILIQEDENEKVAIVNKRTTKLINWNKMINRKLLLDAIGIED